jgi:hypothetical protein
MLIMTLFMIDTYQYGKQKDIDTLLYEMQLYGVTAFAQTLDRLVKNESHLQTPNKKEVIESIVYKSLEEAKKRKDETLMQQAS